MPFDSADALIRPSMTTRIQYSLGHPPPQQTEPLHCPYCDSDNTKRSRPSCSSSSGSPSSASLTQEVSSVAPAKPNSFLAESSACGHIRSRRIQELRGGSGEKRQRRFAGIPVWVVCNFTGKRCLKVYHRG
ncbi:hypothetical protein DVH24_036318 [Malus domestica]|uniref:Uncharacterized protein n=1 Tax=Malus domestica TaxID=3750 RepID=A0A498IIV2_MALDO|nr:hypothetical protein DVH24_036318 [Malus domestica]